MAVKPALHVVCVGGKPLPFVAEGEAHYQALLRQWCTVEFHSVKDHNREPGAAQVRKETDSVVQFLSRREGRKILLDPRGRTFPSEAFAVYFQSCLAASHNIIFVVGGIYGFGEGIEKAVDGRVSLSSLTFNHLLVRLVLMEQIFRAFSILHKTSYHR